MTVLLVPATVAGLAGGLAMLMVGIAAASRWREARLDLVGMWAGLLGTSGTLALVFGVVVHLAVSVAVAVLYAVGFRLIDASDTGSAWGLVGGLIHWLIAGAIVSAIPGEPRLGPFARNLGPRGAGVFLAGHLAYGLVVGTVYFALQPDGGATAIT